MYTMLVKAAALLFNDFCYAMTIHFYRFMIPPEDI